MHRVYKTYDIRIIDTSFTLYAIYVVCITYRIHIMHTVYNMLHAEYITVCIHTHMYAYIKLWVRHRLAHIT